jgi:hypothetical protein
MNKALELAKEANMPRETLDLRHDVDYLSIVDWFIP